MYLLQLLELVRRLRLAGMFVAVAVTRPFLFEGPKKRQAADALTAQLQQSAHLVSAIDQVRKWRLLPGEYNVSAGCSYQATSYPNVF